MFPLSPAGLTGSLLLLALTALASCGTDGPPFRPGSQETAPMPPEGLSITGSSEIGVASD